MKYLLIFALVVTVLLTSCKNSNESSSLILDEVIKLENVAELTTRLNSDQGITYDDKISYNRGIQLLSISKDSLVGKTVRDIIAFDKDKTLNDNMKAGQQSANVFELKNQAPVKLTKFVPTVDANGSPQNTLTYEVYNMSSMTMERVTGMLRLFNKSNNALVKQFELKVSEPIENGKGRAVSMNYLHDTTNNRDLFIRQNLQTGQLRMEWVPDTVIYSDGKILSVPRLK